MPNLNLHKTYKKELSSISKYNIDEVDPNLETDAEKKAKEELYKKYL